MGTPEPVVEEIKETEEELPEEKEDSSASLGKETKTEKEEETAATEEKKEKPATEKTIRPRKTKKMAADETEKEAKTSLKVHAEAEEKKPKEKKEKKWFSFGEEEGQLTVDVYQTENDLVIQTAVAGIKPEDLDITIERDVVTLRGSREKQHQEEGSDYFIQECFWGAFSRQIILPVEVAPSQAKASFKEGVLTIRIPKIQREKKMKINISA